MVGPPCARAAPGVRSHLGPHPAHAPPRARGRPVLAAHPGPGQDRPMDGTGGGSAKRPRRPAMLDPAQADEIPGGYDPALRNEVAHTTAAALVHQGRANTDPEVVARLVQLVEREGLDVVAALWS